MQIRPGRHNGSQPDWRRLSRQVRPRAETETETGPTSCRPGWGWPPGAGADTDRDGGPAPQSRSRHRQGPGAARAQARRGDGGPASRGSSSAPSWLSPGSHGRQWLTSASCRSHTAPMEAARLPAAHSGSLRLPLCAISRDGLLVLV